MSNTDKPIDMTANYGPGNDNYGRDKKVTENEMLLYKGIRQVQKWIEEGKLESASNACTDLLIEYGNGIMYDDDIEKLYSNTIKKH